VGRNLAHRDGAERTKPNLHGISSRCGEHGGVVEGTRDT
jgi:hypothetical protein